MTMTRTLSELRAEVRQRADMESTTYVTDAEITRYLNQSIARLHNIIAQSSEDDFTEACTIITTAGDEFSVLPFHFTALRDVEWYPDGSATTATVTATLSTVPAAADTALVFTDLGDLPRCYPYYATLYTSSGGEITVSETVLVTGEHVVVASGSVVYYLLTLSGSVSGTHGSGVSLSWTGTRWVPSGDPVPMDRFRLAERHRWRNDDGGWSDYTPVSYRLVGKNRDMPSVTSAFDVPTLPESSYHRIHWCPTPQAQHGVRIWYVRQPQTLTEDGDLYDGRAGWEEYVILDAAAKCVVKEEGDATALISERDIFLASIIANVRTRDEARPDQVVDVDAPRMHSLYSRPRGVVF